MGWEGGVMLAGGCCEAGFFDGLEFWDGMEEAVCHRLSVRRACGRYFLRESRFNLDWSTTYWVV